MSVMEMPCCVRKVSSFDVSAVARGSVSLLGLVMFALVLSAPALGQKLPGPWDEVVDDPALPRVLLLGDSISIGYTTPTRMMLGRQANVHRARGNCGPTTKGLEELDNWLGNGKWDLIHFNFGLHDLKYIDDEGNRVSPEEGKLQVPKAKYIENLTRLVGKLKATGAKLVWCNTTPVPEGAVGRIAGDAEAYNEAASAVVKTAGGIEVNDLFGFCKPQLTELQLPRNVHFTSEGSRQLAMQVTNKIRTALDLPSPHRDVAKGRVFEDLNNNGTYEPSDRPMPNVRVSNGAEIVTTDDAGQWQLPAAEDDIFFVIKPRGFRTPLSKNQLPQFFYVHKPDGSPGTRFPGVFPTGALPASIDFPMHKQSEPEQFKALMFGDPQPRTQAEVDYIAHDVIEDLVGTDASFGVTLGDIVFDDLSLFESQARMIALLGIPWYNVIGNHDLNTDAKTDALSDESFERAFGPAYYSFDYGAVHFLVIDNVEWFVDEGNGKGGYRGGLGEEQISFIKNDLAGIPEDQLVVLMMHIPLTDVGDRQELYRLIEKRPFCMSIAAHTHRHEHRMIGKEDGFMGAEPHHHVINVTVSGSWWSGQKDERNIPHTIMADGAPNGHSVLTFDGHEYKLDFVPAGRPKNYQMSIHAPEVVNAKSDDESFVYVNFFNGSVESRLQFKIGESKDWLDMEKVAEEDPYYRAIYKDEQKVLAKFEEDGEKRPFTPLNGGRPSSHLWKAKLPKRLPVGTHLIQVKAHDRHDRTFDGKRVLRVIRK